MTDLITETPDPDLQKSAGENFGDRSFSPNGQLGCHDSGPNDPGDAALVELLRRDRDRQLKALTVELGESLDGRTVVYLDTCFWIHLRDAQRGDHGVRGGELLGRVRGALATGAAIFPISDMTVFEVLKQSPTSRAETAALIAELSQGVSIVDTHRRMATEICHLVKTGRPELDPDQFHPLRHLVWSRGLGMAGMDCPYVPGMDPGQAVRLQRRVLDHLWRSIGAEEVIAAFDAFDDEDFHKLVVELNLRIAKHSGELDSFKTAYGAEAGGVADLAGDVSMEIFADEARAAGIEPPQPGTEAWTQARGRWCALLVAALTNGPKPRQRLRTLHALAALHAAFRWNKGQKFEVNDLYDFEHAAAALGYCQMFFTERPLHHMITAGNLKLDQLFDCRVVHGFDAAIAAIAGLAKPSPSS
ncbi:hypothetical protein [Caulobacter segnis]|uniref:Uncharacterized protein n=1 Tax=Caulobacter segnis TaxID=88688 RepID=A0A2W5VA08_9CAUL|nr:hypothetical protein [Caulobacter segnis]PZR35497.1 MAG: hypothetical protein DI526_06985 [Caulobacter segnis]